MYRPANVILDIQEMLLLHARELQLHLSLLKWLTPAAHPHVGQMPYVLKEIEQQLVNAFQNTLVILMLPVGQNAQPIQSVLQIGLAEIRNVLIPAQGFAVSMLNAELLTILDHALAYLDTLVILLHHANDLRRQFCLWLQRIPVTRTHVALIQIHQE